ncbi:MAG: hypothetical protein LBR73_04930 [Oscillospiraceae bacterium]|jgi:hypothetical protein|nr:hypothetical protein [Oscillospiraceae bacterium]
MYDCCCWLENWRRYSCDYNNYLRAYIRLFNPCGCCRGCCAPPAAEPTAAAAPTATAAEALAALKAANLSPADATALKTMIAAKVAAANA